MRMMSGSPAATLPTLTVHNPVRGWSEQESAWLRTHEQTVTAEGLLPTPPTALIALPAPPRAFDQGWRAQLTWEFQHAGYDVRKGAAAPITVEVDHHGLARLLDGAHRSYAAAAAGLPTVPALVRYLGGAELLATAWQPSTAMRWSGRRAALPPDVLGLLAWYDAKALGLADGAAVSTWADRTGTYPTTVASGPDTYRANGMGARRPAVEMTGTTPRLTPASPWVFPGHASTIFVACVPGSGGNGRLLRVTDYEINVNFGLANQWVISDSGSVNVAVSPLLIPAAIPVVLTVTQRAQNDYDLAVNGVVSRQQVNMANAFGNPLFFGNLVTAAGNLIAEVLLYTRALDGVERGDIEAYLMQRWLP